MKKYIVTAKNPSDIIKLTMNTKSVDIDQVKWDWANVSKSDEDANCPNETVVLDAINHSEWKRVDDMIMSGDVPVGAMVVLCDMHMPKNGFICANGSDWIVKKLEPREANSIVYSIFKGI